MTDPRAALRALQAQPGVLAEICVRRGVLLVTAFGSAIRRDGEPRDLDIAVLTTGVWPTVTCWA